VEQKGGGGAAGTGDVFKLRGCNWRQIGEETGWEGRLQAVVCVTHPTGAHLHAWLETCFRINIPQHPRPSVKTFP